MKKVHISPFFASFFFYFPKPKVLRSKTKEKIRASKGKQLVFICSYPFLISRTRIPFLFILKVVNDGFETTWPITSSSKREKMSKRVEKGVLQYNSYINHLPTI